MIQQLPADFYRRQGEFLLVTMHQDIVEETEVVGIFTSDDLAQAAIVEHKRAMVAADQDAISWDDDFYFWTFKIAEVQLNERIKSRGEE